MVESAHAAPFIQGTAAHSSTSSHAAPSAFSEKPTPHEQLKLPGVLAHWPAQPPLLVLHSFVSVHLIDPALNTLSAEQLGCCPLNVNPALHVRVHDAPGSKLAPGAQPAPSWPLAGAVTPLTKHCAAHRHTGTQDVSLSAALHGGSKGSDNNRDGARRTARARA